MTINEQKAAARTFAEQWAEKVFGVEDPAEHTPFLIFPLIQ